MQLRSRMEMVNNEMQSIVSVCVIFTASIALLSDKHTSELTYAHLPVRATTSLNLFARTHTHQLRGTIVFMKILHKTQLAKLASAWDSWAEWLRRWNRAEAAVVLRSALRAEVSSIVQSILCKEVSRRMTKSPLKSERGE